MTHKHKDKDTKLDQLKTDVAATAAHKGNAQAQSDPVALLSAEHEKLREELNALKSGLGQTLDKSGEELKSEILKHPLQSVVTAFALGFAASLLLRR